jgi:imidazolonepropionase-like amidohydrolase
MVKEKGAFVVPAMAGFSEQLLKHPYYGNTSLPAYAKVQQIIKNYDNWVKLAKETGIDLGFGTDVVVSSLGASRGARDFQMGQWVESFGNFKTLKAMTADNGRLMAFTGKNNRYPGKLGVIEKGAYADIILVDGNPLEDVKLLGASVDMWAPPRSERSIKTIPFVMKDGTIYRNEI